MSIMIRRLIRRYRSCIVMLLLLYLGTCVWLMTSLQMMDGRNGLLNLFERVYDPFGSVTSRRCHVVLDSLEDIKPVASMGMGPISQYAENDVCVVNDVVDWPATIDIEELWDTVSVGYPNMLLSVTGWVETVQVKTWNPKPLHVIIMPHSHQDPGWLDTFDSYYSTKTARTLDLMVLKLIYYPQRKFVWTEVAFLDLWWQKANAETKDKFRRLLKNGQLELLTGGWVMTDESVAHYGAMLDQLTEGQQWIHQTLRATVDNGWAIDPFGHSSTMAYLLGQSGIQNNVIQRAHFAIKRHLAQRQWLEFYWKQYWDRRDNQRVFTHMMPFMLYGIPYSCGPDRTVCCKFDFFKKQCFYGNKHSELVKVDDTNVASLAYEFWEQLQKKSELSKTNVLLVPHGDDFRYHDDNEWDIQFGYMGKIMAYINNNTKMNTKIEFGTLADYFTAINTSPNSPLPHEYPTLSGDLYPYTDRGEQYWSGFYSTRPFYKYIVRKLQGLLRSAEIFFTFSLAKLSVDTSMVKLYGRLQSARRGLALHQHHDAITGTCSTDVAKDYGNRLNTAIRSAQTVLQTATAGLLQKRLRDIYGKEEKANTVNLTLGESYQGPSKLPKHVLLNVGWSPSTVVVSNSLGYQRQELIHILVNRVSVLVTDGKDELEHQISPVWIDRHRLDSGHYLLSFEADIEPFSIHTYVIQQTTTNTRKNNVAKIINITCTDTDTRSAVHSSPFVIHHEGRPSVKVSNQYLTAHFSSCDGMLKSLHYHGEEVQHRSDIHFVTYTTGQRVHPFKDKSGPYTFIPDGPAAELNRSRPVILIVQGNLFTEVKAVYQDITHTATIYNSSGILGLGVHLDNVIHMNSGVWDNSELVMRIETDVRGHQHAFCTDVNGFQLHKRKTRAKMTIQGNFYPVTTMALLDDKDRRFTLLTSSSHGMASLVSGWLEVVLDRRLMQHDWRGLNEGIKDNVPAKSSFFMFFEKRRTHVNINVSKDHKHICLPSMTSDHLSESLNNPLLVFLPSTPSLLTSRRDPLQIHLTRPFPCDLHVMNLRMLSVEENIAKQALLVTHRKGIDCGFRQIHQKCPSKEGLLVSDLSYLGVESVHATTLTGTKDGSKLIISDALDVPAMHIKAFKIGFA